MRVQTDDSPAADDAAAVALGALSWICADDRRAERLLALTGLDAATLRARLDEPPVLAAILAFLLAHESDLLACAAALGIAPARVTSAARALGA